MRSELCPNLRGVLAVCLCLALLLACTLKDNHKAPSDVSPPAATRHAPEVAADWTAGIVSRSSGLPQSRFSLVRKVRAAGHEGYDRIVFEFSEPGIPDLHLEYIDEPVRQCGSGKALYLPGDGWLEMRFTPARMHHQSMTTVADRDMYLRLPVVQRLVATCDFENRVAWVAAVSEPNRYRVLTLDDPPRVVVDIHH